MLYGCKLQNKVIYIMVILSICSNELPTVTGMAG